MTLPKSKLLLFYFLSVVLCLGLFFFFFPSSSSAQTPEILTLWESYNNEEHQVFLELIQPFSQHYLQKYGKPIQVQIARVSHQGLLPKLKMSALTQNTPDICRVDCAHVSNLAFGKAIYPLDTLDNFPQPLFSFRQKYLPAAIQSNLISLPDKSGQQKEHLYGIPDQTNCVALYWNKTLFKENATKLKEAGLDPTRAPQTWSEFVAYGRLLSNPSKNQFAFGMHHTLWWLFPFFNTFGATFFERSPSGHLHCVLDRSEAIEALQFICELYQKNYPNPLKPTQNIRIEGGAWQSGTIEPTQGFLNGIYAMILSGPWNLQTFRQSGLDFAVSPIPKGPIGTSSNVGGTNMVVFRSCKNPKAALELLLFISSDAFQKAWSQRLGQISVRNNAPLDWFQSKEMIVFQEQMKSAKARPTLPFYNRIEQLVNPEIELALRGKKSPQQALKDAVSQINQQLMPLLKK